jgi:hypothetical protein
MANFKQYTRYTNGNTFTNREGVPFLVLRKSLNLQPSSTDTLVTITQDIANRPDLISYKAYGIPDLWWVIYEFNQIYDPLFGLKTGQILRIPDKTSVLTAIQNLNKV